MRALTLALAALVAAPLAAKSPISTQRMSDDVRVLASDPFEGRAPGSKGEAKTIDWLVKRLKAIGLEPAGPGGKWTQDVPLVRTKLGDGTIRIGSTELKQREGVYVSTLRPATRPENRHPPRKVPSSALYPCMPPPPKPATSPAA